MELIYTDSSHVPQGVLRNFELDMAIGDDENDFELSVAAIPEVTYSYRPVEDEAEGYEVEVMQEVGGRLSAFGIDGHAERVVSKNLFDYTKYAFQDDKYVSYSSGNLSTPSTSGMYKATPFMPINLPSGTAISINKPDTNGTYVGMAFYSSNGASAYISGARNRNYENIQVPDGAKFYRFTVPFATDPATVQVELGATSTAYEPYHAPYVEVVKGRNLLDFDTVWHDGYDGPSGVSGAEGYVTLTPIKVNVGDVYTCSYSNRDGSNDYFRVVGYKADKTFHSRVINGNYDTFTFSIPDGVSYIAFFRPKVSNIGNAQLERGSVATPYVHYGIMSVVATGKNLCPETYTVGKFYNDSGTLTSGNISNSEQIRVSPNSTYTISMNVVSTPNYTDMRVHEFDAGGKWIRQTAYAQGFLSGSTGVKTRTIQTGANAAYVVFACYRQNVDKVQFEQGSTATAYEPYTSSKSLVNIGSNVLASLPNGIKDELRVEGGKAVITKRVGVVDLGTQNYSVSSPGVYLLTNPTFGIKDIPDPSCVCAPYEQVPTAIPTGDRDKVFKILDKRNIYIKDTSYTTAADFKAAMAGVLLYYELATPYEVELQDVEMPEYFNGYTRMYVDAAVRAYMRARYVFRLAIETFQEVARFDPGSYVYEYGTDRGGVIDAVEYDGTGKVPLFKYSGRTWHGIMENSVTRPDAGASHLILNGDLNSCISTLISRAGLTDVFAVPDEPCGVSAANYQIPRYINLYEALTRLCRDHGMRLEITKGGGMAFVYAVQRTEWLNGYLSDLNASMRLSSIERPCNHLVLLGEGEMAQRLVMDVYADANGNVSTTQTLFGVDEVCEVYEQSNESDPSNLLEAGAKKLAEMQADADVSMKLPDGAGYALGDIVEGIAVDAGFKATAEVIKQVISVDDDGFCSVSYEAGLPSLSPLR